jgi:DNA-directed RNA polymerase subunit H
MFPPCTIVRNLIYHFFRYRGLELAARGLAPDGVVPNFTEDRVIGDMESFQYTRIDARRLEPRGKRDWVVILVLNGNGKYSKHSPELRKLLGGVATEGAAKAGRLDELIVVAEEDFFARKALVDLISDLQQESAFRRSVEKINTIDAIGVAAFYNAHPYRNFSVVVPEHQSVFPHIIMSPEEVAALLTEFYMVRTDLPAIYASDPPLVWLGAREGDAVKIVRRSPTAATSIYYRRVERGVTA